jgi:cysteinyl-tRNA synthetase
MVGETLASFLDRLSDDLDTPGAVATLFEYVRKCNQALETGLDQAAGRVLADGLGLMSRDLLGLSLEYGDRAAGKEQFLLGLLSENRSVLRRARLFAEADTMRRNLAEEGYSVKDLPGGESRIEKISSAP